MSLPNPLWAHFDKGEKKNQSQFNTYCTACVKNYQDWHPVDLSDAIDAASELWIKAAAYKQAFIAHIIGGKGISPCKYASDAAKEEATCQRGETKATTAAQLVGPSKKHGRTNSDEAQAEADQNAPNKKEKVTILTLVKAVTGERMPFTKQAKAAIQAQSLRAVISTNSSFALFEDPDVRDPNGRDGNGTSEWRRIEHPTHNTISL
ncbi:hypothetical protein C8J56DRAFT_1060472 [Mycena floridula]|nr:hypothetical protein C8J56DRAFT_1060472 [Mycena floridula]